MKVMLQPSGAVLQVQPGEAILEAARRQGYSCPHSCRNGNCHVCGALLLEGRVRQQEVELDQGEIFTCIAAPLQDCVLSWGDVLAPDELPVRSLTCQVTSCESLGADVWRVRLLAPAGKPVRYHAGQYLLIERQDGGKSAFSVASAPHCGRELELHVLAREASALSLLQQLRARKMARVQLPFGDTFLTELPDAPLLLIAAGTGMAQMQSLIEDCRARGFKHPVHLYWGARRPEDFYAIEHWENWQALDNFFLHRVVSDPLPWQGRTGLLHEAIRQDFSDLRALHVYVSGSPNMVYATLDALVEAGMDVGQMHADAFAYAPR